MTGGHWRALVSLPPSHRITNQYKSSHIPLRVMVPPVLTYFNFGIICCESFCSSLKYSCCWLAFLVSPSSKVVSMSAPAMSQSFQCRA